MEAAGCVVWRHGESSFVIICKWYELVYFLDKKCLLVATFVNLTFLTFVFVRQATCRSDSVEFKVTLLCGVLQPAAGIMEADDRQK